MTLAAYHGHEALTFPDYTDLGTGKTLHAEPRDEPYDIAPASGRAAPDIPAGWFTPVSAEVAEVQLETVEPAETDEDAGAPAEGDGAPEPGGEQEAGEPAHDQDPETGDPQQF